MKIRGILAVAMVAAALTSCSSSTGDGAGAGSDTMTCEELADEAVRISEEQDVKLLKVRAPEVSLDKQETGWDKPTGTSEVTVLRCNGQGVWSDGTNSGVQLSLKVDADDDAFVYYQQKG
jgi:hypothetical protein